MEFFLKLLFWLILAISIYFVKISTPIIYPNASQILESMGWFLIIYGLTLNIIAGRTLRKLGHRKPSKKFSQPDRVVSEGIFSCMRHPAIFGIIFILIGLSFTTGKIIVALYSAIPLAVGEYFIMATEEKQTIIRLKDEYCEFLKKRPPFNPSIKCLVEGIKAAFFTKKDRFS